MIYHTFVALVFISVIVASILLGGEQRGSVSPTTVDQRAADLGYAARQAQLVETGADGRPLYTIDAALIDEVLTMYVKLTPKAVAEMALAVLDANGEALRIAAHAFNGSSRTIGAERIAAVCTSLEAAAVARDFATADRLLTMIRQETSYLADELHTISAPPKTARPAIRREKAASAPAAGHGRRSKHPKPEQEKAA